MPGRPKRSPHGVESIKSIPAGGTTWSLVPDSVYMRVSLERSTEDARRGFESVIAMEALISRALLNSFGIAGAASISYGPVEFDDASGTGILNVPVDCASEFWAALTMVTAASGRPVRVVVSHATPFLYTLARETVPPP
jgi:RNase P/RNase MRP subunit POP5